MPKIYRTSGNSRLLRLAPDKFGSLLDLGCGTGNLGEYVSRPNMLVDGITNSSEEAQRAGPHYRNVWEWDLEAGLPELETEYDIVFMSHILEHIAFPSSLLECVRKTISPEGCVLCAIPNMLFLYNRLKLLFGKIEYEEYGIMDYTHLRWYTKKSVINLFAQHGFKCDAFAVTGNTPMGPLRRIAPAAILDPIDQKIVGRLPGLLAWEYLFRFSLDRTVDEPA